MKIIFKDVNKNYGPITALKNINLNIDSGEFVLVSGPSGAGKSTLLKLILHQTRPSSGDIIIGETSLTSQKHLKIDDVRRQIGVIFQDYQLIPDKTVEENIALSLDINNYPLPNRQNQIDSVLKKTNLTSRRYLFPSQLSGGEMQRTALARALAVEPKIILADEPTGNLDLENSWNLIKLLKEINETFKTTILMTTHNTDVLESLNKRAIYLRNGEIEKDTSFQITSPSPIIIHRPKKLKKKKAATHEHS